ncbi:MAG: hypothetical protein JSR11_03575 [Bacteroidetes bacterium]|nr:hypothetical protein [Bacteroidota bacterium]
MGAVKVYNINWPKLIRWMLPIDWRKPKIYTLLKSMVAPLMVTYSDFLAYKKKVDAELKITTQLCRLRGALNDKVDKDLRRITITRGTGGNVLHVYTEAENRPQYLPKYLGIGGVNYIINVPVLLYTKEADIKLFLTRYNLEPLTWRINYV